ncbi:hypothetical protein CAC01_30860 (plasmid) [Streptomyces sp. CLI2509]|nr:hypothetical protein CAC01_30860 [Streptomyces sp. CLI2509]
MNDVVVDPEKLPTQSFTASDIARIELGRKAHRGAQRLGGYARMLGEDVAIAGDYVRQALHTRWDADSLMDAAVIAERVRGTGWEAIGAALHMTPEAAEEKWKDKVSSWHSRSVVSSGVLKDPGSYAASVDHYITTDKPYMSSTSTRRPLSQALDAAAHLTGRDVAAANAAFGGTVCGSCGH